MSLKKPESIQRLYEFHKPGPCGVVVKDHSEIPEGYYAVGSHKKHNKLYRSAYCKLEVIKTLRHPSGFGETLVTGKPNKPYFDIDWYGTSLDPKVVLSTILESIHNVLNELIVKHNTQSNDIIIRASECSRDYTKKDGTVVYKNSFHLVINCPFYFQGGKPSIYMATLVVKDLESRGVDKEIIKAIDFEVYSDKRLMRLVFNGKDLNDTKPLWPVDPYTTKRLDWPIDPVTLESLDDTGMDVDETEYYITYIPTEKLENMTLLKPEEQVKGRPMSTPNRDNTNGYNKQTYVRDYVQKLFPEWKIRPKPDQCPMGNIESRKEVCPIHGYVHNSQNLHYIQVKNKIIIKCHSKKVGLRDQIVKPIPEPYDIYLEKFDTTTTLLIHLDHIKTLVGGKDSAWAEVFYKLICSVIVFRSDKINLVWNGHVYEPLTMTEVKFILNESLANLHSDAKKMIFNIEDENERKILLKKWNGICLNVLFERGLSTTISKCNTRWNELQETATKFDGIIQCHDKIVKVNPEYRPSNQIDINDFHIAYIEDASNCVVLDEPSRDMYVKNYTQRKIKLTNIDPEGLVMKFLMDIHMNEGTPDFHTMYNLIFALFLGISRRPPKEAYFLYGKMGNNGKSTLFEFIEMALGQLVGSMTSDMFCKPNQTSPGIVQNKDKSILLCADLPDGYQLEDTQIKQFVSGGKDSANVRDLYAPPESFRPQFTIFINCNNLPKYNIFDKSMDRRVCIMVYDQMFVDDAEMKPGYLPIDEPFIDNIKNNYMDDFLSLIVLLGKKIDFQTNGKGFLKSKRSKDAKDVLVATNPSNIFHLEFIKEEIGSYILVSDLKTRITEFCSQNKIKKTEIDINMVMRSHAIDVVDGQTIYKDVTFKK